MQESWLYGIFKTRYARLKCLTTILSLCYHPGMGKFRFLSEEEKQPIEIPEDILQQLASALSSLDDYMNKKYADRTEATIIAFGVPQNPCYALNFDGDSPALTVTLFLDDLVDHEYEVTAYWRRLDNIVE